MSEPREPRRTTLEEIVQANEERRDLLLQNAMRLEDEYGVSIPELCRIYSDSILKYNSPDAVVVEKWLSLCDTLRTTHKSKVALVWQKTRLAPTDESSTGIKHESNADVIIITNPHEATFSFGDERPNGSGMRQAYITAMGYRLAQSEHHNGEAVFDDLGAEPSPIKAVIAEGLENACFGNAAYERFGLIAAGDTFVELFEELAKQHEQDAETFQAFCADNAFRQLLNQGVR